MTEFISRKYGNEGYEVIIKTDNHEHYKASENFARQLIDHAKPVTDNNGGCKWIPVSERLPELMENVLLLLTCDDAVVGYRCDKFWRVTWTSSKLDNDEVTHWMPLPEPPKEENK